MLGARKKHPQAYFLYVEDCFLQSDNADAPYIFKRSIVWYNEKQYQYYLNTVNEVIHGKNEGAEYDRYCRQTKRKGCDGR